MDRTLPKRVRVLVLGGGINGLGVAHDILSRGWQDVLVLEKTKIGFGTSSRSSKLIHGGLRYLQNPRQFPLVYESLHERRLLLDLVPDLVKPLELLIPIFRNRPSSAMPGWKINLGLTLYDLLANDKKFPKHFWVPEKKLYEVATALTPNLFSGAYSYWDAQTDDLSFSQRVGQSIIKLGGEIFEGCSAHQIQATPDGWRVTITTSSNEKQYVDALYVVNAMGPWCQDLKFMAAPQEEIQSSIPPVLTEQEHLHTGLHNKGSHLIFDSWGLKHGFYLPSLQGDGRFIFVLPWLGKTLIGTTETPFKQHPDKVSVDFTDIEYLLKVCGCYFSKPPKTADILCSFAGLRWLNTPKKVRSLSTMNREAVIDEQTSARGLYLTLYGGKYTTYRSIGKKIGDRIMDHYGDSRTSKTHLKDAWAQPTSPKNNPNQAELVERFKILESVYQEEITSSVTQEIT